ncbi:tripartite tricarboxylate transporter substrate binding protein [Aminivibrio sp.]
MKKFFVLIPLAFVCFSGFQSVALAADYPSQPLNFIVAYGAGGGTDVSARVFEPYLKKYLGTNVGVVNKPGGNGEVGFSAIATSKPDGYTIGILNFPVFFINMDIRETSYSMDDFEIWLLWVVRNIMIGVSVDSKIENLDSLIAEAKKNPGVLTIGSSGNFSDDYLGYLQFQKATGIELNHVAFKGAGPARTAVIGGHVNLIAFNVDEAIPFVKNNQIRLLGVMSEKRHPQLPDVPTFKEQGYDVFSGSTRGIAAPKGLPKEISDMLKEALKKALNDPEHVEKVNKMGQTFEYVEPDEYEKILQNEAMLTKELLTGVK